MPEYVLRLISYYVKTQNETVWLSANQMAFLFGRDEKTIRKHINNVFSENEVDRNNNTKKMRVDGVKQPVPFYTLDVIISVGYRVKSKRGVEFRRWANSVLKNYILKGYLRRVMKVIQSMKFGDESDLFGKEKDDSFKGSIGNIYQSFWGIEIYESLEEKAANLLYFVTKNHSFFGGNKRIAATMFLYFLDKNVTLFVDGKKKIEDSTLVIDHYDC